MSMVYLLAKAALSGVLVLIISEISKRSPSFGGLIASLPLLSVLAMLWLWRETADVERLATHAESTFWFVLPSLPLFLILPALLRHGVTFSLAMTISCLITMALYGIMIWALRHFGIAL